MSIAQHRAGSRAPASDADPFSIEFFEDPHRIHDELREAGPVVWLSRYGSTRSRATRRSTPS
jgi:hypothetical protein